MLVFEERGKPEYPEKNLSGQRRERTTSSTHIWCQVWESNPRHIGGRSALSPLRHPCSPKWEHQELIATCTCICMISDLHACLMRTRACAKTCSSLDKNKELIISKETYGQICGLINSSQKQFTCFYKMFCCFQHFSWSNIVKLIMVLLT